MEKVRPHPDYPPEEGRYLRGNDFPPAAVVVILNKPEEAIPREIEELVRVGVESGAALSGTVETENIGFKKIICTIIANPNIRYTVLTGPESPGRLSISNGFVPRLPSSICNSRGPRRRCERRSGPATRKNRSSSRVYRCTT